ncbi:hypothetical protein SLEP1_g44901 [Rubroshorea leprosula]|uniref:Secreted protein n=1 Tax=Rubroshorea leprosula TaxID=152421 RepID=A0AAV5LHN9_9ROSI|nr:hypothetical protein SLEP1_g44901 [Rubroshorea leprosula]
MVLDGGSPLVLAMLPLRLISSFRCRLPRNVESDLLWIDLVAEVLGSPLSRKRKLSTHSHLGSPPFPIWELFAGAVCVCEFSWNFADHVV